MRLLAVSHRRQQQQADCLAACAAMVLDYLQIRAEYEQLIQLLGIRAYGAAFSNLRRLKALGVHVEIAQGDREVLRSVIEQGLPVIAALDTAFLSYWAEKTDHAVVVAGVDVDTVLVHDPDLAEGPHAVPMAQFDLAWFEHSYRYAVLTT